VQALNPQVVQHSLVASEPLPNMIEIARILLMVMLFVLMDLFFSALPLDLCQAFSVSQHVEGFVGPLVLLHSCETISLYFAQGENCTKTQCKTRATKTSFWNLRVTKME